MSNLIGEAVSRHQDPAIEEGHTVSKEHGCFGIAKSGTLLNGGASIMPGVFFILYTN